MSDWKEITKMGKVIQPLLKLSSEQYDVIAIIHLIFIILNSFQFTFLLLCWCEHPGFMCSVCTNSSKPKGLSRTESTAFGSWQLWATRVHPAQHLSALTTNRDTNVRHNMLWVSFQKPCRALAGTVQWDGRAKHLGSPISSLDGGWQRIMWVSVLFQMFVALVGVAFLQNPNPPALLPFLLSVWISPGCPEQLKSLLLMTHAILLHFALLGW